MPVLSLSRRNMPRLALEMKRGVSPFLFPLWLLTGIFTEARRAHLL
jgi:hypothetical protein